MAANEIHVGDIGTIFRTTVKEGSSVLDISAATTTQLIFRRPDGTSFTKTAEFTTDGTDGKIEYPTIAGDLDVAGNWSWQSYIVMPSGSWHTDIGTFSVHANLS